MKAIVCDSYGLPSNLKYIDVPTPNPKADEVLIQIKACSINFPDTLIIQGLYQVKPDLPFSPGSDVAGIVEAVGENVKHYKAGDEVVAMVPYGGLAEKITVPACIRFHQIESDLRSNTKLEIITNIFTGNYNQWPYHQPFIVFFPP